MIFDVFIYIKIAYMLLATSRVFLSLFGCFVEKLNHFNRFQAWKEKRSKTRDDQKRNHVIILLI